MWVVLVDLVGANGGGHGSQGSDDDGCRGDARVLGNIIAENLKWIQHLLRCNWLEVLLGL